MSLAPESTGRWYDGVTRYQWLVLVIASLGWVFDVFEGQIFVASMNEAMPSLLPEEIRSLSEEARRGRIAYYNNIIFGAFLLGGALGGVGFGILSDRIGRKKAMTWTILIYSLFTCVSAFSQEWWHMAVFRFLVALGVGGEWAVASALVAEVFPKRARAWSLGIFHASSVLGTYLAIAAGAFIVGNPALQSPENPSLAWRLGFVVGVLPAVLIVWIRTSLREPEQWQQARTSAMEDVGRKLGSFGELFHPGLLRRTLVGVGLATVGLATFWGVHIYGKDLLRRDVLPRYIPSASADDPSEETRAPEARRQRIAALVAEAERDFGANVETAQRDAVIEAMAARDLRKSKVQVAERGAAFHVEAHFAGGESFSLAEMTDRDRAEAHRELLQASLARLTERIKLWEMLGMLLVTTGGGLGLVAFGPVAEWIGRRGAFLLYQIGGLLSAVVMFQWLSGVEVLMLALPLFGFLTLGMHAGFAIYFPELYPTRLRGTGGGFCFNVGRIFAAPILFLSGSLQQDWGFSLENAASLLSCLFIPGVALLLLAPETRGRELPE